MSLLAVAASAQTSPTLYGTLSNFDVENTTGQEMYGFEIQLEGVSPQDITYTFGGTYIRYGTPIIVPYATGVYVRYMAQWDTAQQKFTTATPVAVNPSPTGGHLCYTGALGSNYWTSGCEHFGVGLARNATTTTYRWLAADPNNAGMLTPLDPPVSIAAPVWTVIPPARAGDPAVVAADVDAPNPPVQFQFGEAQWMKVYKTEADRQVGLEELLSDNPVVPEQAAQLETSWYLMQDGGNGKRKRKRNQGALGGNSHSVLRRYEFYKFTGTYDPLTHEAICADGLCNVPADVEVGDYIGAQMAAANLNVPAKATITVASSGNGSVTGTVGGIKCGTACTATVEAGTAISLTASANSGSAFTGWGGACNGLALTCQLTLNSDTQVSAAFQPVFGLSVGRSGKGTVASSPAGINCGSGGSCSAKFVQGTSVTITAAPLAGGAFVSWSGACSGTSPSCNVTINKDTQVQANFK